MSDSLAHARHERRVILRRCTVARVVLVTVLAGMSGVLLASCGSISGLNGAVGEGDDAGLSVLPGQPAGFTAFISNHSGETVTLHSATLLPLPGFRAPKLVHLAVEPGLDFATSSRNWPPTGQNIVPFAGYRVRSGHRVQILYVVQADALGDYAARGVRVKVVGGGDSATVDAISIGEACVVPNSSMNCPSAFSARINRVAEAAP